MRPAARLRGPKFGGAACRFGVCLGGMEIERVDTQNSAAVWYELLRVAHPVDTPEDPPPCRDDAVGQLIHPRPDRESLLFAARAEGTPLGAYLLQRSLLENTDVACLELVVHPAHRRRGVGRALIEHLAGQAKALGCTRLVAGVEDPLGEDGPGSRFAAALGFTPVLRERRRRLDLAAVDPGEHERLLAAAREHSAGYTTVCWRDSAPEEHAADYAYLFGRLSADAPMDDLSWEPERYDIERIRTLERHILLRGFHSYAAAARHDATGRLVGVTRISLPGCHRHFAYQEETLVLPEHRGRRLGLRLKIENLLWARQHEPELRLIDTWNADSNDWMVAINERLGFRELRRSAEWEKRL